MHESSAPPQLPPPTLSPPTLPPPPPVAQSNAPSGPPELFAAITHQALTAQTDLRQQTISRRRRRDKVVATVAVVVSVALTVYLVGRLGQSEPSATSATLTSGAAFTVDTPDFHFALPAEPVTETVEQELFGTTIPTTQWTVDTNDQSLMVLAIDFGMTIDDVMAQGAFDSMDGGLARTIDGTIVSQELTSTDGVIARRTVVDSDAAQFTMYHFAKGTWVVSIGGAAEGVDPSDLVAIRDSFSFE